MSELNVEIRAGGELRAINEEGEFEGYLTVWDTVDDYKSTFTRGSFAKTIQERGSKVKIFYDHEHLVGSSVELREDDYGVFGRGKINRSVDKAEEAYQFMKDGTLEGLSFGFRTTKEGFKDGVREIREIELFEYGPVTFPANDKALITGVRAKDLASVLTQSDEKGRQFVAYEERSEDFTETLTQEQLFDKQQNLFDAIHYTLDEIWWSGNTTDEIRAKADEALASFHAAYLEFINEWISTFWNETRSGPAANAISQAMTTFMIEQRKSVEDIATSTSLTLQELQALRKGELIEARSKLNDLPETIRLAHQQQRGSAVEQLCTELRNGLSEPEKRRISALLQPVETQSEPEPSDVVAALEHIQQKINH